MPNRAMRPCAMPGCPNVVQRGSYCDLHARATKRDMRGDYHNTARWQRMRRMTLRAHPLCADPFGEHGTTPVLAREVDHIVPLADGGSNDATNLQCLCKSCHSRKTREDMQRRASGVGGSKSL